MMGYVKAATVTSMFWGGRACAARASPDDPSLVTNTFPATAQVTAEPRGSFDKNG